MKAGRVFTVLCALLVAWIGLVHAGISAQDVAGTPDAYCTVVEEPDPALMGGWKCIFVRQTEEGTSEANPVQYWLVKRGERYALYYFRIAREGRKRYVGWRDWTINGKEMNSNSGVRVFLQDGKVYFSWQGNTPVEMEPIGHQ